MRGGTTIGIGRKLANPSTFSICRQTLAPFSTSSNGGGGRGRGRGVPSPKAPSLINFLSETFPTPDSDSTTSDPLPGAGHGRGKPLSQSPSSFSSGIQPGPSAGRGQASHVQPSDSGVLKKPVFFRREDAEEKEDLMTSFGGTGRGWTVSAPEVQSVEEKRHIGAPVEPLREPRKPKLSREEAVKQAMKILEQGGGEGPEVDFGGGGGGGRGGERMGRGGGGGGVERMGRGGGGERMMQGRGGGRGRGGRGGRGRRDGDGDRIRDGDGNEGGIVSDFFHAENPEDEEKLAKRVGPEVMNQLNEAFNELCEDVLPLPVNEAYVDALDMNCMIEFEPEYLMGDFNQNPDIDEKPPLPIRDALEKMRPYMMASYGIQSQEDWEELVEETMKKLPLMKEIVNHYSGPDRVTVKKQKEELERVAKTLPAKIPDSVKQFTDRAVLSLQGNPGWGFHRKWQFMDKLTEKVSKHYK